MTRKLAGFGLAFALAELAAAYLPPLASLLTAALFISLFLFAAFTQRRAARFALPAVAGLLAGLVWSAAYQLAVVKPAQSLAGQTYACTAIVQPDAETSWQPGNVRATLLITRLDGRKTSLKVYCTDLPYSEAGDIITGQFQLQPLRADSYRMSRYAKGTWLGASYQTDYIWQGTSDALPYRLYHLRQAFAKRLSTYLPQDLAGVEAAMLLGEKSELTDEWSDTFRTAGIAHLLAVSGLHVALLCGLFAMGQGRRPVLGSAGPAANHGSAALYGADRAAVLGVPCGRYVSHHAGGQPFAPAAGFPYRAGVGRHHHWGAAAFCPV